MSSLSPCRYSRGSRQRNCRATASVAPAGDAPALQRIGGSHCGHSSKAAGSRAGDGPVGFCLFTPKDKPNSGAEKGNFIFSETLRVFFLCRGVMKTNERLELGFSRRAVILRVRDEINNDGNSAKAATRKELKL